LTYSVGASTGCSVGGTTVSVINASLPCALTAIKAGDSTYDLATSEPFTVTLQRASQTILFTSTPSAAPTVGGPAYVVAATGGGSGQPVTFSTSSAACSVSGSTVTFVAAGSCVVAANQLGNANYLAAPQVTQAMTVSTGGGPAATTTDIVSLRNPSEFSDAVVFAASVRRGPLPISAGTVTFKEGATVLAANVPINPLGLAFVTSSSLSVGTHTITAFYNGTASNAPSSGSVTQVVKKAKTKAALASNHNPSNRNQAVTFTVTVTHDTAPVTAGTVTFKEGSTVLAGPLALSAAGKASFTKSNLAAGSHAITVTYAGTGNFEGSTDNLTQVVRR
jgi:hypothetical protein